MEPLLLVEDKTELRAMLRKALERNGFRVEEAPDGSAAIQKLRSKRYQMVVTDLKMPGVEKQFPLGSGKRRLLEFEDGFVGRQVNPDAISQRLDQNILVEFFFANF